MVLKNAFNSNSTLAENASIVKWEDVSSDEKKKLMNSLKNEMLANGSTVPIANIMFARARQYYNNLRARFLRNTDPEKRRDLRKRSKLHVYSHVSCNKTCSGWYVNFRYRTDLGKMSGSKKGWKIDDCDMLKND